MIENNSPNNYMSYTNKIYMFDEAFGDKIIIL